jgi:DNA-directed RNA polymerase specialized sigma24 family protein
MINNYDEMLSSIKEEDFILFMDVIKSTKKSSKAYSQLFKKHKNIIYQIIYRKHSLLISNIELYAKSIFQDALVKVQKNIITQKYQYDGRATFRTYIIEFYKRIAYEFSREITKRKFDLFEEDENTMEYFCTPNTSTPYLDAFQYAIQKIENNIHRKVLKRIILEGDAVKSIADNFGIKPITVRQIKNRKLPFIKMEMMKYDTSLQIG